MFSVVSVSCLIYFALVGLLVHILTFIRSMDPPADPSNRIAHLILVWEALKSPHRFVGLKNKDGEVMFKYLEQDLGEFARGRR